jgi:hypothetical protein
MKLKTLLDPITPEAVKYVRELEEVYQKASKEVEKDEGLSRRQRIGNSFCFSPNPADLSVLKDVSKGDDNLFFDALYAIALYRKPLSFDSGKLANALAYVGAFASQEVFRESVSGIKEIGSGVHRKDAKVATAFLIRNLKRASA